MAKVENVTRKDIFYVPFPKLEIIEGFNDREDYGDIEELAESIYHQGVKVPLKGYKDGDKYKIIVGHRRLKAGELIKKKYNHTVIYPLITYPKGSTITEFLIDTLLSNDGKNLTPLEKSSVVKKLIEAKMSIKDIGKALGGVSDIYVNNLLRLSDAPEKAKKMIRNGDVSATLIMGFLRNKKADINELLDQAQAQADCIQKPNKKKKTAKVTAKTVQKNYKLNSIAEFRRFRKQGNDIYENKAKQEAFEFVCRLIDNEASYDQILEFFTGK